MADWCSYYSIGVVMGIKLRDYMDKDKMELTREEVRELLYEIFNVSKDEQKILAEKLELENKNV